MRTGWKEVELGELTDIVNGYAFKSSDFDDNGEIPLVKIKSIKNRNLDLTNGDFLNVDFLKINSKFHINYNDVLIALTGSHITLPSSAVGRVAKSRHKSTLLLNQRVGKFKVKDGVCSHDFLYHFLTTEFFFNSIGLRAKGAANQANISTDDIKGIKVNFPPLEIQQKIASILSTYDYLIENNLKRIELLEEMAQQTYEEWFVRMRFPGYETAVIDEETGLPEGWGIKLLKEVSSINSKSIKKKIEGLIKYIDIASVSTKNIDYTTNYEINLAPGRAKRIIRHKDIIWSCVRPNRRSYAMIWNPEVNTIASTGFCVITPESVPSTYLYQHLTTDSFVAKLTSLAGGAAYPAVKAEDFADSEIILPTKILLEEYNKIFESNFYVTNNLKNQNQGLKEARDILLPRLMMGIIEV